MQGLMQQQPLMISSLLRHAARHHGGTEIVSRTTEGAIHRTDWRRAGTRARRLARALQAPRHQAARSCRHAGLERPSASRDLLRRPRHGAICHTINPRLHPDDIAYIINDAADRVLFADTSFAALIQTIAPQVTASIRAVVMLTDPANMPDIALPAGMRAALL